MSYKRHKENKRKIGQEHSSMQQAHYQCHRPTPWMQESVTMHKSLYSCQALAHESSKVEGRGKREEERQGRQRKGGWWKEKQSNYQKPIWRNKTRPSSAQLRLTKLEEERLTSPSNRMRPSAPKSFSNEIFVLTERCSNANILLPMLGEIIFRRIRFG